MTAGDWRPRRPLGVWTRRSGDKTVLEGYIDVYETNHVGAYIWARCGEGLTAGEICAKVAAHYGIDADRAASTTRRFLDELHAKGFLVKDTLEGQEGGGS